MRDLNKIRAFQLADEFVVALYQASKSFPREEIYGLTSQIRRAAVSVPANIAEGSKRQTKKDYVHFLFIAYGSLAEAAYLLRLSEKLGYIEPGRFVLLDKKREEVSKTLAGLIASVKKEI